MHNKIDNFDKLLTKVEKFAQKLKLGFSVPELKQSNSPGLNSTKEP